MAWKGTDVKVITLIYIGAIQNVHNVPMHTIVDGRNMKIVHMVAINGIVTQSEVSVRGPTKAQKLWCRSEVGVFNWDWDSFLPTICVSQIIITHD